MMIVCDNASNNDTMVEAIAQWCKNDGISFDALSGRGCCFPHTTHLSALKVQKYLLLSRNDPDQHLTVTRRSWHFSPSTKNKEMYQESVTAPLSRENDDDAAMQEDNNEDDPGESLASVFTAIGKVSHRHG